MRQTIAFSKVFGIEVPVMSGPNFTLTVKNGVLPLIMNLLLELL